MELANRMRPIPAWTIMLTLATTGIAAGLSSVPLATAQCPNICQAICEEVDFIQCNDMGRSNGLAFTAAIEQNETAIESQTSGGAGDGDPIEDAGTLRILSTWELGATQDATTVLIQLGTPTGISYTSSASASYNQSSAEDTHEEPFEFSVNAGFSGNASVPYVITTNAGTASEDTLNGTLTFKVSSGTPSGTATSPSSNTPGPGLVVIVAAIVAALVLLRRRLGAAGTAVRKALRRATAWHPAPSWAPRAILG